MATPPYAKLQYRINGGGLQTGAQTVAGGVTIQLTAESKTGWSTARWELFDYPDNFAAPAGWSTDAPNRKYYVTGTADPPSFTLDAAATRWGPYGFRLIVDDGTKNGQGDARTDEQSAVRVLSPKGQYDLMLYEENQFGGFPLAWLDTYRKNLRVIESQLGGGGGVTPTGTGFYHATGGVLDGATKLVDTADVNANQITDTLLRQGGACSIIGRSANSTGNVADIAAGSNDTLLKRSSNALSFASLVNADVNSAAAIAGTKISPDFGSQDVATTGNLLPGSGTRAASGIIRVKNAAGPIVAARNAGNSADIPALDVDSGGNIVLGEGTNTTAVANKAYGGGRVYAYIGGNIIVEVSGSNILASKPIQGSQSAASPYSCHGGVIEAGTDANYTPAAAVYAYDFIDFTTARTAQRDVTWPNPSTKDLGYYKTCRNTSGQNLVHKTGAASATYTQATGTIARIWVEHDIVRGVSSL